MDEVRRYEKAYESPDYRIGLTRLMNVMDVLRYGEMRDSILDVGCGRGEILQLCRAMGFRLCRGVEAVPALVDNEMVMHGYAWSLPYNSNQFETVICIDVLEHLLRGDEIRAIRELGRVARKRIIITASNMSSVYPEIGELHINRRVYDEWEKLIVENLPGWEVKKLEKTWDSKLEMWEARR
jgi:ubiquinone/menaquinone biosynthesis C-methylase UbiE